MSNQKIKRKTYVIDKSFQYRFIATFLILILVSLLIFSGLFSLYYFIRYMYGDNIFDEIIIVSERIPVLDTDGNIINYEQKQTPTWRPWVVIPPILINNIIIMIVVAIIGIFYSHKIAGPAYRISQDIKRVIDGEKNIQIRLRKKDKLQELAASVNVLIAELDKHRK